MRKTPVKHSPFKVAIIFLFAIILGFFTMWLLPQIVATFIISSQIIDPRPPADLPHRCEGDLVKAEQNDGWIDELETWLRQR